MSEEALLYRLPIGRFRVLLGASFIAAALPAWVCARAYLGIRRRKAAFTAQGRLGVFVAAALALLLCVLRFATTGWVLRPGVDADILLLVLCLVLSLGSALMLLALVIEMVWNAGRRKEAAPPDTDETDC